MGTSQYLLSLSISALVAARAFEWVGANNLAGAGATLGLAVLAMVTLCSPRLQRLSFSLWVLVFTACAMS